jgi:hypothetical protein
VEFPGAQIERLDDLIVPLVTVRAAGLLSLYGVGPDTAALLLIAAGDRPERLRSEAAWAHMCAVAPIRPHRGRPGDTGSTAAGTARPATPCGGSCSLVVLAVGIALADLAFHSRRCVSVPRA